MPQVKRPVPGDTGGLGLPIHRHVVDTRRPDAGADSEPDTQQHPTVAATAPAWAHSRSGDTRFRICYKYTCLVSEGDRGGEGAVHSCRGLEAERHIDRQTVRPAGQPGQHSGACNTCLVGTPAGRGGSSRARRAQAPRGLPGLRSWAAWAAAPGLSSHHSGPGGTEGLVRRTLGHVGAQAGPQVAGGSPCGRTRAGRRRPGAHPSCSTSAASALPASASAAARASGSRCSGGGGAGVRDVLSGPPAPRPLGPRPGPQKGVQLTGFLLHSMKPIWPLG